jgi:Tol biopolymer transport system component
MRSRPVRATLALGLVVLVSADCVAAQRRRREARQPDPSFETARVTTLKEGGARLDWIDDRIAFDMLGADGFFDVYSMRADGRDVRCLTCDHPDLPGRRHIGQPAWHPSGRYLVVQAEKAQHAKVRDPHRLTPGAGRLNDLWVLDLQSNRATLVREVRDAPGQGVLHPHFSTDGSQLSWTELKGEGEGWALMVADFRVDRGRARLESVQSLSPGGRGFYENHGFSPDGSRLIYTSDVDSKLIHMADIYVIDLRTRKATRLASDGYNEHALYSPDGRHIAWISTVGARGGTDYWIMDADGSNKRRLTFFNEKGHPHYAGRKVVVADLAWRPDGTAFAGYYREGGSMESVRHPTKIILVELPRAVSPRRTGSANER